MLTQEERATKILGLMCDVGVSVDNAPSCGVTNEVFGTLDAVGYALTDRTLQPVLFPAMEQIMSRASMALRSGIIIGFAEPFTRYIEDVFNDEEFLRYMEWFFSLQARPDTRWVVDDTYELLGSDRYTSDRSIVAKARATFAG